MAQVIFFLNTYAFLEKKKKKKTKPVENELNDKRLITKSIELIQAGTNKNNHFSFGLKSPENLKGESHSPAKKARPSGTKPGNKDSCSSLNTSVKLPSISKSKERSPKNPGSVLRSSTTTPMENQLFNCSSSKEELHLLHGELRDCSEQERILKPEPPRTRNSNPNTDEVYNQTYESKSPTKLTKLNELTELNTLNKSNISHSSRSVSPNTKMKHLHSNSPPSSYHSNRKTNHSSNNYTHSQSINTTSHTHTQGHGHGHGHGHTQGQGHSHSKTNNASPEHHLPLQRFYNHNQSHNQSHKQNQNHNLSQSNCNKQNRQSANQRNNGQSNGFVGSGESLSSEENVPVLLRNCEKLKNPPHRYSDVGGAQKLSRLAVNNHTNGRVNSEEFKNIQKINERKSTVFKKDSAKLHQKNSKNDAKVLKTKIKASVQNVYKLDFNKSNTAKTFKKKSRAATAPRYLLTDQEKSTYEGRFPKSYRKVDLLGKYGSILSFSNFIFRGGCALVWLGRNIEDDKLFALKQFPKSQNEKMKQMSMNSEIIVASHLFKAGGKPHTELEAHPGTPLPFQTL